MQFFFLDYIPSTTPFGEFDNIYFMVIMDTTSRSLGMEYLSLWNINMWALPLCASCVDAGRKYVWDSKPLPWTKCLDDISVLRSTRNKCLLQQKHPVWHFTASIPESIVSINYWQNTTYKRTILVSLSLSAIMYEAKG